MKEDAEDAAKFVLDEVFSDFPFKDVASRANVFAALITVLTKPMIKGNIPLGLFDKPQAGTGASLLTEVVAEVTTGRAACMQTQPGTDEEWRKAITSVLTLGPQIVVIDNVSNMLRSAKLSQVLTATTWRDRILGQSKMIDLPQTAAWFATGNNIQIGGDIARRAYWIRIDAEDARPWLRNGFKHPELKEWIREHRGELLSKLVTMVQAWVVAGRPKSNVKPVGSFEEWTNVIGGILAYAGVEGFLGNAKELYDSADQENAQWDLFLEEWQKLHRSDPITAAILKAELTDYHDVYKTFQNEMPEEIIKATGKGTRGALALGQTLRRRADQIFPSGRKLTSVIDTHTKTSQWKAITVKTADRKVVEETPSPFSECDPTQKQAREPFAGIEKSQKSQSSDPFAGIAGIGFVLSKFEEKIPVYTYSIEQIPAIPANQQAEPQNSKNEIPADRPITVSENNQQPPAVGAKIEAEDEGPRTGKINMPTPAAKTPGPNKHCGLCQMWC